MLVFVCGVMDCRSPENFLVFFSFFETEPTRPVRPAPPAPLPDLLFTAQQ